MMRFFLFQEHEEDLLDLIHEKEVLEEKILQREQTIREWAQKFIEAIDKQKLIQTNYENLLQQQYKCQEKKKNSPQTMFVLLDSILSYCIEQMQNALEKKRDGQSSNKMDKLEIAIASASKVQELSRKFKDSDGRESKMLFFIFFLRIISSSNDSSILN